MKKQVENSKGIYKAINLVMKDIKPIAKGRKNTQQNYSFRGIDDAMNAFSSVLQKHGVFPAIVKAEDLESQEVTSARGAKGYRVVRRYTIRFYHIDGSFIDVISDGEAIDYGDKTSNKAMSVAYRESLFKTFVVPFGNDDIETESHDIQSSVSAPQASVTASKKDVDMIISLSKEIGGDDYFEQLKSFQAEKYGIGGLTELTSTQALEIITDLNKLLKKKNEEQSTKN